MILVLLVDEESDLNATTVANLIYLHFSNARNIRTDILVQTVAGNNFPIVLDKGAKPIVLDEKYALVFGAIDAHLEVYPNAFTSLNRSNFKTDVGASLRMILGMPVFVIS